jgi:hypothetical protein
MKFSTIVVLLGLIVAGFGGYVLFRGLEYKEKHGVEVGEFKATFTESKPIPAWVGGAALAAGSCWPG